MFFFVFMLGFVADDCLLFLIKYVCVSFVMYYVMLHDLCVLCLYFVLFVCVLSLWLVVLCGLVVCVGFCVVMCA